MPVSGVWSETWALMKADQKVLERTEMRMLRWLMGTKRIGKIGTEEIRTKAGVTHISEKMR